jgi:uncharacterized coiled-coil protein SlyX
MKNPLTTLAGHDQRLDAHARRLFEVETLALEHSQLLGQAVQAMDISHRRIGELENDSASQLKRIENLEACIRTQAGLLKSADERLAQLERQQRIRDPLSPFGPVFGPRPGFNPGPGLPNTMLFTKTDDPLKWPSTLFPNGMPTFTAQQAQDDADALRFAFTNLATGAITANAIAEGAFIQDTRAIARMSTMPVGKDLNPTDGLTPV